MKIGFLGAGRIAWTHMEVLKSLADEFNLRLAGAFDPSSGAINRFVSEWGGRAFSTPEELLDEPDLDAVYVVAPTPWHVEYAEAVAERGLALYLEKPVALDLVSSLRAGDAIRRSKIIHCVGLNWRYRGLVQRAKKLLDAAGGPALMSARWFWFTPTVPWLRDRSKSGGQVLDQVIHLVDMFYHLAGPAERVSAWYSLGSSPEYDDFNNWDVHSLQIRFKSGCIGSIVSTYKLNVSMSDFVEVEFVSDGLRLSLTDTELRVYDREKCTVFRESGDSRMEMLGRIGIERAFLQAVKTGRQDLIVSDIDEAVASIKIVFAATKAAGGEIIQEVDALV